MADHDPETNPGNPFTGMLTEDRAAIAQRLGELERQLAGLDVDAPLTERAHVVLDRAEALLGLDRHADAWQSVRPLLEPLVQAAAWQEAVEACDILYRAEQDTSLIALGHGLWLGVTYPIMAHTTVGLLNHLVDETPEDSIAAGVAAMAAHYIAGLRTEGRERDNLTFLTNQTIAKVARRHRGIEDQDTLETWIEVHDLNNLDTLFPRLGKLIDAIVGDRWWFDRDALRARLPDD